MNIEAYNLDSLRKLVWSLQDEIRNIPVPAVGAPELIKTEPARYTVYYIRDLMQCFITQK